MENENQTLFTQYQKPFPKPIESKLKTSQFIEAAKGVLCLLGLFAFLNSIQNLIVFGFLKITLGKLLHQLDMI